MTGSGRSKVAKLRPVGQREVDGDPWRERTVWADIGFGVENHHDGRSVVEMGIEVPPLIVASFGADALTVLKPRDFSRGDAKPLVIGRTIRKPKVGIPGALHRYLFYRDEFIR